MTKKISQQNHIGLVARAALLSVSCTALGLFGDIAAVRAQSSDNKQLPAIEVLSPSQVKRRTAGTPAAQRASRGAQRRSQAARTPEPQNAPKTFGVSQDARTGTVGIYANSTSVATKTNTPLINIPQSLTVLTKEYIRDQNFQNLTDVTRYMPGVACIRAKATATNSSFAASIPAPTSSSTAFATTSSIFRDLYNTQSIELLRGPSALTFGRGVGGGLLNRTLKEADAAASTKRRRRPDRIPTGASLSMPARRSTRTSPCA